MTVKDVKQRSCLILKNNNEIWKPVTIKGFKDQYMISNLGRIMRLTRIIKDKFKGQTRIRKIQSKILKPGLKENGYLKVSLHNQQLDKNCYVHRLVAQAFIPNPNKLPQINHKNENKLDNRVSNLEWCNAHYNNIYHNRSKKVAKKRSYIVYQYDKNKNLVKIWPSAKEAGRHGFSQGNISACCRGEYKQYRNYIWKYQKDVINNV